MKKIDHPGLILCDLQAQAFELSLEAFSCSSEIFIRRFMNSMAAKELDSGSALNTVVTPMDLLGRVEEQYGVSKYGSIKYSANEIYWIGYIYRYFSYTYELSSSQVFRMIKPKDLKTMYPAYHTMDCAQAIERFFESKGIELADTIEKQYQVFRRIRKPADHSSSPEASGI